MREDVWLCLNNECGEVIAIKIANFPILPVGSPLTIKDDDTILCDGEKIAYYGYDIRGIEVDVTVGENSYKRISGLCIKDDNDYFAFMYPKELILPH